MTTDWTFTPPPSPPTAMPRDMLARRVDEVEQQWYRAEAELARTRAELAEARAALGRIVAATRPGRERGTYGAAVAHSQASWALRTQGPKPSAPPPEPPYRPDQDPSPWQPRQVAP